MSIKKSLAVSGAWTVAGAVFNNLSTLIVFFVLARLLSPTEFGLVAFASVFVDISRTMVIAGTPDVLIKHADWDEVLASTLFWLNLIVGVVLGICLIAGAALIPGQEYRGTFQAVLIVLSLSLLIDTAAVVQQAKLRREFKFKELATAGMSGRIASSVVGVALAFAGGGVWALVISRLMTSISTTAMLWRATDFRPRLVFSVPMVREHWGYSTQQLGSQLLAQGNEQVLPLVVGTFLGPAALGQYRVGSRILNLVASLVIRPLQTTALSAFSSVARKNGNIGSAYLKITRACAIVACPVYFGLAATAPDFVRVLFGPQWQQASYVLLALALISGPATLNYFQGPLLSAVGRSGMRFWSSLVSFVSNACISLLTVSLGPVGVAAGHTARAHLTTPFSLMMTRRAIGLNARDAIKSIAPVYLTSAAMGLAVFGIRLALSDMVPWMRLLICIVAGLAIFLLINLVFARKFVRSSFDEIIPLLPSKFRGAVATIAGKIV